MLLVRVGDNNVSAVRDEWNLIVTAEVVVCYCKSQAEVFGIAVVILEKHEIAVKLRVHGTQVRQHMKEVVVATKKTQKEMSKLRLDRDSFIKSFSRRS